MDAFREFNFERIYLRPASVAQAEKVIELLRALTDWFAHHPARIGSTVSTTLLPGSPAAIALAVRHVSGMTDRYAMSSAVTHLGWDPAKLPLAA